MRKVINVFGIMIIFTAGFLLGSVTTQNSKLDQVSIAEAGENECSKFYISKCVYTPADSEYPTDTYDLKIGHRTKRILCGEGKNWPPTMLPYCMKTAIIN